MSDFFDLVKQRESCRNYNPDKRPTKEQLVNCIEAAGLAPSACNSQPWSFIVINDPQKSPEVAHSIQASGINQFTEKCPAFIVICEEPAYLIGRPEPNQKYAQMDIGIATAHLCFAATQQGLSTCIMGAFDSEKLHETLGLPADKNIRLVLAVGHAANDQLRPKRRKAVDEIMTYIG